MRPPPCAIMVRNGIVHHRIDAFQIHAHHLVPFMLAEPFDRSIFIVPDSRVGHENVEPPEPLAGELDKLLRIRHFAQIRLAGFDARSVLTGFLLDSGRGLAIGAVAKNYVRAGLRKQFDRRRPDAPRPSRDQRRFAGKRNHGWPRGTNSRKIETGSGEPPGSPHLC